MTSQKVKIGWAIFLIVLMSGSTIGFIHGGSSYDDPVTKTFRGYDVVTHSGTWNIVINENNVLPLGYDPVFLKDLSYVPIDSSRGKIYITFDPTHDSTVIDPVISRLGEIYLFKNIITQRSCLREADCTEDIPIINCASDNSVVWINPSNNTQMYKDGSCTVLEGDTLGLDQLVDRILLEEVLP